MKTSLQSAQRKKQCGVAMIAVLVILLALFALSAPFLMSVRNADRASAELTDRAASRLALDSALRHVRANLGASHSGVDRTPYYDSEDELEVSNDFPADFYDASDPLGVMWDVDVQDLSGLIDLNSVSHHTMANLFGGVARTLEAMEHTDRKIQVGSAGGFDQSGFIWLEAELLSYGALEASEFRQLTRGLLAEEPVKGEPAPCGPALASGHALGTYVIDQRSFALPLWRMFHGGADQLASLDSLLQAAQAKPYTMIGELPVSFLETLQRTSTVDGHVGAGSKWQNPTRLLRQRDGEDVPTCRFELEDTRFINPGSTLRISDGERVEFALVREVNERNVTLMEPLVNSYDPRRTSFSALARRAVNINTASPEVLQALIVNLKLRGKQARITSSEAIQLVSVISESRPFTSFEDFVRRVVLPAGGFKSLPADAPVVPEVLANLQGQGQLSASGERQPLGFIDEDDARALYKNARNANDRELEFSTMPFCFTSRDLYSIEMRASINAKSGVERAQRVRQEIDLIVPQKPLFKLWHRQADFDEQARLDRAAPGWVSGPEPTLRTAGRFPSRLPSRSLAHLGNFDSAELTFRAKQEGTPVIQTFASKEGPAWLQLAPARTHDTGNRSGRVLHFDYETESLEGHYLPDGSLDYRGGDPLVQFTSAPVPSGTANVLLPPIGSLPSTASAGGAGSGLMSAVSFEMWIKPESLAQGSTFLSAGSGFSSSGPFGLSDLVELVIDKENLVLRVRDGLPDHLATPAFEELAEVRYPLNTGPGLPLDVWTHVSAGVAGTRPDQMRLLVDGRLASDATGMTRLSAALSSDGTRIAVESTEGFPDACVLLIGEELIEASKTGPGSFDAVFQFSGERAGFGGRLARETFEGVNPERNLGLASKQTSYPQGTTVQLYGYSLPLGDEVPGVRGSLAAAIGNFQVGRAVGLRQGGQDYVNVPAGGAGAEDKQPEIQVNFSTGFVPYIPTVGFGLGGGTALDEIFIESADANVPLSRTLEAFSSTGGYALLVAKQRTLSASFAGGGSATRMDDSNGFELGGIEVIRYSGVTNRGLIVAAREDNLPELMLQTPQGTTKSFVFQWNEDENDQEFPAWNLNLTDQTFVIPISIPVSGALRVPQPTGNNSELIQLTRLDGEADQTEWVRYNKLANGSAVRFDPAAWTLLTIAVFGGQAASGSAGLVAPIIPRLPSGARGGPQPRAPRPAPSAAPSSAGQSQQSGAYWHYAMGQPDQTNVVVPVADAISSALQFRGVMGTFSHAHPASTLVLPVFRIRSQANHDVARGMPGRFDHVTLFEDLGQGPSRGVPGTVHRAHRAHEHLVYAYQNSGALSATPSGTPIQRPQDVSLLNYTYVALDNFTAHIANSNLLQPGSALNVSLETRTTARMAKFPAGELPRAVERVSLGGSLSGQGSVASAVLDEVVFGKDSLDHQKVLDNDIGEMGASLRVRALRYPGGDSIPSGRLLRGMPAGSGLLSVGDEVMAYIGLDPDGDTITVDALGRGLLGSTPQSHAAGEAIVLMEDFVVGSLQNDMDAEESFLLLDSLSGFPEQGGLVLVDQELIHYTRISNGQLEMPARSEEPGRSDARAAGLFRGRFGTDVETHAAGTPVILFPFRYWDRWSPRADAPELDFFEFSLDQPGAFIGKLFWELDEGPLGGVRLGVLQRLGRETPWDQDPLADRKLELLYSGNLSKGGNPIGAQADSVQWRAFVEYERGAFDALAGLSHAWKTTPRLTSFGVEYVAPGLVLRRMDR